MNFSAHPRTLNALLNHVCTFKTTELHGSTWYQCLWYGVEMSSNDALENALQKHHYKCFKEWKYPRERIYHTNFPAIDCSVRINHETYGLLNGDIQS